MMLQCTTSWYEVNYAHICCMSKVGVLGSAPPRMGSKRLKSGVLRPVSNALADGWCSFGAGLDSAWAPLEVLQGCFLCFG